MIDHSNKCDILTDGICTCGGSRNPVFVPGGYPALNPGTTTIAYGCSGAYDCKAETHWMGCYSGDKCDDPDCEADKPHVRHY